MTLARTLLLLVLAPTFGCQIDKNLGDLDDAGSGDGSASVSPRL